MGKFTTLYYLTADIGTWTIGGLTLYLSRRGLTIHQSRLLAFGACAAMTVTSVAVPFLPDGLALEAGLLIVAFGALGLTLGASAHFSLAAIYPLEGMIADATDSYAVVLGGIGVAPLIAFFVLVRYWPPERPPAPAPTSP
jgi:ACS family hexuronate transporter-like MFS transporter